MAKLKAGLSANAKTSLKDERRKAFLSVGTGILLILLLITIWFVAFRVVRRWEKILISKEELEKEIDEHNRTEDALREKGGILKVNDFVCFSPKAPQVSVILATKTATILPRSFAGEAHEKGGVGVSP